MAYGDVGSFMPSETSFRGDPGSYMAAIKGEATKRSTYLSQMDQFYAGLEEQARQFDLGYELEELKFGLEEERFDWDKKYGTGMLELKGRELDIQSEYYTGSLDIEKDKLSLARRSQFQSETQSRRDYDLAQEEMDLYREGMEAQERTTQRTIGAASRAVNTGGGMPEDRVVRSTHQNWWDAIPT